jgi:hypothetical protein
MQHASHDGCTILVYIRRWLWQGRIADSSVRADRSLAFKTLLATEAEPIMDQPTHPYEELPVDIRQRVEHAARLAGQDAKTLVLTAVLDRLSRLERPSPCEARLSLDDRLRARGLVDTIDDDQPADLSSNPQHMEGFGEGDDRPRPH